MGVETALHEMCTIADMPYGASRLPQERTRRLSPVSARQRSTTQCEGDVC